MHPNTHPDDIIGARKEPVDYGWGSWAHSAPLKKNALQTLRKEFSQLGFGTGPICRRKAFIRVPIHWIYPANRPNPPHRFYDSVGAVKIPCQEPDAPWEFNYTSTCVWLDTFGQFFDRFLEKWHPGDLFSEIGLSEIRRFSRAVKDGKRCPESEKIVRYHWVRRHPELWDHPVEMLAEMRRYKLYKTSTPDSQALTHVKTWIDRAKSEDAPDGTLIKRKYGGNPAWPPMSPEDWLRYTSCS